MSPAASTDRDAMFATSAELDDGALAELREFTAAFEQRLADAPPTESVPRTASRAAAHQGRGTMPAPVFLPQARDVEIAGRAGAIRLRVLAPERDAAGVFLHLHGGGWVLGGCDLQDELLWELVQATGLCAVSVE
jgi:acetyl esterase/lipase